MGRIDFLCEPTMKTLFLFRHIVLTAIVFIVLGFLFQRYIPIKTYANHYPVRCETDSSGNRLFCPDGRLYVNHCEYACGTSPNECWSEPSCNAPIDCRDTIDPTRPIDSTSAYSTYCDSLTPQGGNDSCGIKEVRCATENGTCFSYYDACPTPTPTPASTPTPTPIPPTPTPIPPTPTPVPGTPSCNLNRSCSGSTCTFTSSYYDGTSWLSSYQHTLQPDSINNPSASTGWQGNGTITHTYATGTYTAQLYARRND